MTVQPNNVNTCDERPIEYTLQQDHNIPVFRAEFGEQILAYTTLSLNRSLLYHVPCSASPSPPQPIEISVIYHRAGYDVEEYTEAGLECRYHLEKSLAIKAPSVLCHMATLKVVQQGLSKDGALERFLPSADAERVRKTFMPMYPLDTSPEGAHARILATDPETARNYVLKPSLEGGGHNIYGEDIPAFLEMLPEAEWGEYILMELIRSPLVSNILPTPQEVYSGPVVSELGIFGTCLWREGVAGGEAGDSNPAATTPPEILENEEAGFSFKTKESGVKEMSVVKGYGCFDSPFLI